MVGKIIYILGIIAAIWCVLDIWKKDIDMVKKILLTVLVLVCSWIGIAVYYFIIRKKI